MKAHASILIIVILMFISCQQDNTALYNEAVTLEENMEYEKAVEKLTEALSIDKNDVECLNNRAWDYYDLDQKEKALEDFNRMLEIDPLNTGAIYGIAYLDYEAGNYTKALDLFNQIIEIQGSLEQEINRSKKKATINAPLDLVFEFKMIAEDALGIVREADTLDISGEPDSLESAPVIAD